jgi:hypothetical protein
VHHTHAHRCSLCLCALLAVPGARCLLQVRWEECDRCQARIQQVGRQLCGSLGAWRGLCVGLILIVTAALFRSAPETPPPHLNIHAQEGLASEAELQSWFVRRISSYLARHNRRIIGEQGGREGPEVPPTASCNRQLQRQQEGWQRRGALSPPTHTQLQGAAKQFIARASLAAQRAPG